MKKIILLALLVLPLLASNIVGTWKLSNTHPIDFSGIIGYGMTIQFKDDGTFVQITKNMNLVKHHYKINNDELLVYLKSQNNNPVQDFMFKHSSNTQTYKITQLDKNCYQAVDTKRTSNQFKMCKQ